MVATNADVIRLLPHLHGFLNDWIERQRVLAGVPGVQVAVRIGTDLLYSRAFGEANSDSHERLSTAHTFRIASHSKTFTAVAIMQLVERGALRLDDTVGAHLPELADSPIGSATIRELLGHQSGAERDGRDANWWQRQKPFPSREELIANLREERVFPANTHFHYSNLTYSLLGLLIEAARGASYDEAVRAMLQPMRDAMTEPVLIGPDLGVDGGFGLANSEASGHGIPLGQRGLTGHAELAPPVIPPVHTHVEGPATGFWANAETISAWVAAHALGTGLFLTDESKRLMQREESRITANGVTRAYGLGWISRKIGDRRVIGHSGGFPGHITQTWADPETGLAVSVLTNRIDGPATTLANGIVALIDLAATHAGAAADATVPIPELAGRYLSLWGDVSFAPLPGAMLQLTPGSPDPAGAAVVMRLDEHGGLRSDAQDGFGDAGEVAALERNDHNDITAVTITGVTHYRPEEYVTLQAGMLAI